MDLTNGLNHIGPIKFEGAGWLSRYILPPPEDTAPAQKPEL